MTCMALFTDRVGRAYAQRHMPKPATGEGPWGEAVEYWLKEKKIRQADLARATGIEPKIISKIARGFHTSTRSLERIAVALELPLDAVLVSPDRKSALEERKRMIMEITELVTRRVEGKPPMQVQPPILSVEEATEKLNEALSAAKKRQEVSSEIVRPRIGRKK